MTARILVADDDPAICELIQHSLEDAGFTVRLAANGLIAHQLALKEPPDLILLDWMMPMMSGVHVIAKLKQESVCEHIPTILITAKEDEQDIIKGLEAGADDYISKPFSPRELVARIKALLRRSSDNSGQQVLSADKIELDRSSQRCKIAEADVPLGPLEYKLLEFFMRHPNRVFSRDQLLDHIWGGAVYISQRTVDVHIRRLRQTISACGQDKMVQTVRGSGYRFSPPS